MHTWEALCASHVHLLHNTGYKFKAILGRHHFLLFSSSGHGSLHCCTKPWLDMSKAAVSRRCAKKALCVATDAQPTPEFIGLTHKRIPIE